MKSVDNLKSFKDYNSGKNTYELNGSMKIVSNEDEFTYNVTVSVKDNKYYKVSLVNTINNHEQVILRNTDGVYVVTPELNKSFKFMSEWPNNSSQAYLLESLVNDVNKDSASSIKEENGGYTVEAKVDYPNNEKLDHEIITTDKDFNIKNVKVMDSNNQVQIEVNINKIDYKAKFSDNHFDLDKLTSDNKETKKDDKNVDEECLASCTDTVEKCKSTCKIESSGTILEDIIYPLYVPTDTYLSSKDTVSTDNGNRVILTFAGVDPFILVEEVSSVNDELNIIPVSGEPLFLGSTIGAISDNSLYWTSNGVDYYLTSKTLDKNEMMTIAESVQNSSNLVAGLK